MKILINSKWKDTNTKDCVTEEDLKPTKVSDKEYKDFQQEEYLKNRDMYK